MPVDLPLAERCVSLLKEMIKLDPIAVGALCDYRVACDGELAKHPTLQVTPGHMLDLLGVLNGLCGVYDTGERAGCGAVAVVFDDETGDAVDAALLQGGRFT